MVVPHQPGRLRDTGRLRHERPFLREAFGKVCRAGQRVLAVAGDDAVAGGATVVGIPAQPIEGAQQSGRLARVAARPGSPGDHLHLDPPIGAQGDETETQPPQSARLSRNARRAALPVGVGTAM